MQGCLIFRHTVDVLLARVKQQIEIQTLHAEASSDPSGLEATQNISFPWPYLRKNRKGQTKQ